jgi:hypothetical protein
MYFIYLIFKEIGTDTVVKLLLECFIFTYSDFSLYFIRMYIVITEQYFVLEKASLKTGNDSVP